MTRRVSARVSCESGPRMVFRDVRVVCVALLRRVASRLRGVGWLLLVGIIARHGPHFVARSVYELGRRVRLDRVQFVWWLVRVFNVCCGWLSKGNKTPRWAANLEHIYGVQGTDYCVHTRIENLLQSLSFKRVIIQATTCHARALATGRADAARRCAVQPMARGGAPGRGSSWGKRGPCSRDSWLPRLPDRSCRTVDSSRIAVFARQTS